MMMKLTSITTLQLKDSRYFAFSVTKVTLLDVLYLTKAGAFTTMLYHTQKNGLSSTKLSKYRWNKPTH